jgi:divalent metal cation (Fe/Co/Zn/Cd) transporter
LFVDTRNDIVACIASLGGFALTKTGYGWGDAMFAVMLSLYVFYNGADLGNENLIYIMGGAPEKVVMDELRDIAGNVSGVTSVGRIRAQFTGQDLQVDVCIVVPSDILAGEAHDVSVAVQRALEADDRIAVAFVHVDTDETIERRH